MSLSEYKSELTDRAANEKAQAWVDKANGFLHGEFKSPHLNVTIDDYNYFTENGTKEYHAKNAALYVYNLDHNE